MSTDSAHDVMGRFTRQHRRVEVSQSAYGPVTAVRLRRVESVPVVELGCIDRIGSCSVWRCRYGAGGRRCRGVADDRAVGVWFHAAGREAEVEG
jgi:hypothetical protein